MSKIAVIAVTLLLIPWATMSLASAAEIQELVAESPVVEFLWVAKGNADFVDTSAKPYQKGVDGFWISKYEIAGDVYDVFLKHFDGDKRARHSAEPVDSQYQPAVALSSGKVAQRGVSWFGAYAFCKWSGGSLPAYEEWCKAGFWNPKTRERMTYPWGNSRDVPHNRDRTKTPLPDSFPGDVSFYGVRNMAGAPAEWIDKWDGDEYTVAMGYYFRGDKGQSFHVNSSHEQCGFRIVLRKLALGGLAPAAPLSEPERKRLSELVVKLGAAQFAERNDAERKLAAAGASARAVLAEHVHSPDPEVQFRVRKILSRKAVLRLRLSVTKSPKGETKVHWTLVPVSVAKPNANGRRETAPSAGARAEKIGNPGREAP